MNTGTTMTKEAIDAFNNSAFGRLVNVLMAQEPGITRGEAVRRTAEARPDAHIAYLKSIGWITSGEEESEESQAAIYSSEERAGADDSPARITRAQLEDETRAAYDTGKHKSMSDARDAVIAQHLRVSGKKVMAIME